MSRDAVEVPLACAPDAIPPSARPAHFALLHHLFSELAPERVEEANGYRFRFASEALGDLARFVADERLCCPFLVFTLEVAPDGGAVWLRMTGPPGAREFLDTQLPEPRRRDVEA